MNNEHVISLSVKQLFEPTTQYLIPIYQRNYAWGEVQISQLISDLIGSYKETESTNYYLGTMIVDLNKVGDSNQAWAIIDGQQRHTTLSILLAVLKSYKIELPLENPNLSFECRQLSQETLIGLFSTGDNLKKNFTHFEASMWNAFQIAKKELAERLSTCEYRKFAAYLLNNVYLVRAGLPEKTDVNHYFEIMNNRGEQLESHEVIKARMMDKLDKSGADVFAQIWDACSQMGHYIQYNFNKAFRDELFGYDLEKLSCRALINQCWFKHVEESLSGLNIQQETTTPYINSCNDDSIEALFNSSELLPRESQNQIVNDQSTRFSSVINFPNFLLQVLKVHLEFDKSSSEAVTLDDRKLINEFDKHLFKNENQPVTSQDIKKFASTLFKLRYLFDRNVIKRDLGCDQNPWSVKKLKQKDGLIQATNTFKEHNEQAVMIQTMFHASFPSHNYKNWLAKLLKYLYTHGELSESQILSQLESQAREQFDKIAKINSSTDSARNQSVFKEHINRGTQTHNYFFNYLDYKIWKILKVTDKEHYKNLLLGNVQAEYIDMTTFNQLNAIANIFKFTSRSSVEHHYPQHSKTIEMDEDLNNSFANLCLLSNSSNASLGNASPEEKKRNTISKFGNKAESLKQRLMFCYINWYQPNLPKEACGIYLHEQSMIDLLLSDSDIIIPSYKS